VPPVQTPLWQVSPVEQRLSSLQDVPFAALGFEQIPVAGLQVPATWHWSLAVQTFVVPGLHAPAWHVSPVVQALPSSHSVPFALGRGDEQVDAAPSFVVLVIKQTDSMQGSDGCLQS
jgi:hypothetical protein